jgi:LEA14-like dessication related protein
MSQRVLAHLLLFVCLAMLLGACSGESFKPCQVEVQGVRPAKGSASRLLGALMGGGQAEGLELVVTLKVANPNDRAIEIRGLEGVVEGPKGELGAFRLPPDTLLPLPAKGSAVVDVIATPGSGFLKGALALLTREGRAELTATGHVDVSTWLGVRRVEFNHVRLGGGAAGIKP